MYRAPFAALLLRALWLTSAGLAAICLSGLLVGCSGDNRPKEAPRPTEPATSGWVEFESESLTGLIKPDWIVQEVDLDNTLGQAATSSTIPPELRNLAETFMRSGVHIGKIPLITLPGRQNISAITCQPGFATTDQVRAGLSAQGIQSQVAGKVLVDGTERDLLRLTIVGDFVSYQVYATSGTCTSIFTLTVRSGDEAVAEDFKFFLSHLSFGLRK